ncbi:DUF4429 domain-containing protein [Streptomyces xantholiticus]|uniref:DUF4429 domain-containing protein n=1 Tax=Streptomyces xantholiticus TaxID=68285 RepID=UPI001673976D|nr:DUF4429 domain-containing protein [Streptomyces xantholiticus]GGW29297.1 hypothetical protein GCM10010381_12340 [Streptomyces xantholiticus]
MAEIIQKDGTWTFDGDTVRIVPGNDKSVSLLRRTLGEVTVPLVALAGISFESGKKAGRMRLRLRDGADPLLQITGGRLDDASDPYRLSVEPGRFGVAEYFVDEVRHALLLEQMDPGALDAYVLPGPPLPITVGAGDETVTFDGERIRLEWNWKASESKQSGGTRTLAPADVRSVEWLPAAGLENGCLRFQVTPEPTRTPPKHDPHAVELWGFRKDPLMALVAAAVAARMPHPYAAGTPVPDTSSAPAAAADDASGTPGKSVMSETPGTPGSEDHDVLLRRLRELGELHQAGILTEDEFSTAKKAVLKRM